MKRVPILLEFFRCQVVHFDDWHGRDKFIGRSIEFFRILLGIDSNAPGFKSIRIAPSLGDLKEVSGTMPHPVGSVTASYKLDKKGKLTARLILPTGTDGVFVWKGKEYQLKSGEQVLTVE